MFVDATGRRHRLMRRIAYAIGAACLTYTGLVAASVIGHTARPGALALLPAPTDRPHSVVRQSGPPKPAASGVPLPSGGPRLPGEAPMRLQSRETELPSTPHPQPEPAPPRTRSTPLPTPTIGLPAPTKRTYPPSPDPTYQPGPGATDQPEPQPTGSPAPGPTPPSAGPAR